MGKNKLKRKPNLVVINSANKIRYYKRCKIIFDKYAKELTIIPRKKDAVSIIANFDRYFLQHKNIICIEKYQNDTNKYFLILPTEKICKNIYDSTQKAKALATDAASDNDEIFETEFLIPILKECVFDPALEDQLKPTILKLLKFYKSKSEIDHSQNKEIIRDKTSKSVRSGLNRRGKGTGENNKRKRVLRTRENINYEMDENNEGSSNGEARNVNRKRSHSESEQFPPLDNIIYAPNFKVINYIRKGISKSTLFIFPTSDRKRCYEFYYDSAKRFYVCCGCKGNKWISAAIEKDTNGNDFVRCLRTDHSCKPRQFLPENYKSDLIIRKPNYDLIEKTVNGSNVKYLLLFTSNDKKSFYKMRYIRLRKLYYCIQCNSRKRQNKRKYISAQVCHDKNGNEFVYVRNFKHVCSNKKYLEYEEAAAMESTTAKELDGEKISTYKVQITSLKKIKDNSQPMHQHQLSSSTTQIHEESKIIQKPNFQIFERIHQGRMLKKLAIFDSNDKKMCYEMNWVNRDQRFVCNFCNYLSKHVFAKIINNSNGEEYVQMGKNDHMCELKKFNL